MTYLNNLLLSVDDVVWTPDARDAAVDTRIRNVLKNLNIYYVWELTRLTERELMRNCNFGKISLATVKNRLTELGLHLGMDIADPRAVLNRMTDQVFIKEDFT